MGLPQESFTQYFALFEEDIQIYTDRLSHTHIKMEHTHTICRLSQADNGQWNCAIREGCCPVTGQLGQQMVIFPSTNTNQEGEEGWGVRLSRVISVTVWTFHQIHGNDSAIMHKANELDSDNDLQKSVQSYNTETVCLNLKSEIHGSPDPAYSLK